MIEFIGGGGKPFFIVKSKIIGVQEKTPETTSIFVGCETESEEWIAQEPLGNVMEKYYNAFM
jgi:hypothetical protein